MKTAYEVNNNKEGSPTRYTVDLSEANKDVIAYGSITDEESKGSFDESGNVVWKQFTIDLKYRDLTRNILSSLLLQVNMVTSLPAVKAVSC